MRLTGRAWPEFFDTYERSAFRLETLPVYAMHDEQDEFRRFLAGERPPPDLHYTWLDRVAKFRATGRTIGRVHVLTRPLTDYIRYEFDWAYAFNVQAGEDIRILDVTDSPEHPLLSAGDFWMLDEKHVVSLQYREDGTQIGRELLTDPDIAKYVALRDLALAGAVPFEDYRTA
ncbi:DUF6879 family protein [Embleya sp. AB8]|uniref:DUF6879 family protein n=1 Tax=Embleya sp. AB8 TaxID=3156304 RepID=UPI003C772601